MEQALREDVLAIVVASRRDTGLPALLQRLTARDGGPVRIVVAVTDGAKPVLDKLDPRVSVHNVEARTFFETVNAVAAGDEPWLWLLHGDSLPHESCLDELLAAGESSQKIGAVGPKQVRRGDPRHLIEVGIRATRWARRVEEVAPGELDQGQYDWREDVLAVGSNGMLVRRAALEAVGGFDSALGPFGDGLELSRRLWFGGWRVVVRPSAVIEHAQESWRTHEHRSRERGEQIYNALLAVPPGALPLAFIAVVVAAPLRSLIRLAGKDVRGARSEWGGLWFVFRHIGAFTRARVRVRRAKAVPSAVLRSLESSGRDVRAAKRDAKRAMKDAAAMADMPGPLELKSEMEHKASTWRWGIAAAVVVAIVGLVAMLPVIGKGVLAGGALLADSWGVRDLVAAAHSSWIPSGQGIPGSVDALWIAFLPLVAVFGSLGAAASALIVAAVPLAGIIAYLAAGRLTASPQVRFLMALGWAFAPPLLAAVSYGQVAAVFAHLLLPAAAASIASHWQSRSSTSLALASLAWAGLALASPGFSLTAVVIAVVGGIVRRPRLRWIWLAIVPLAAVGPTLWRAAHLGGGWRILLASPGASVAVDPSAYSMLGLDPVGTATNVRSLVPVALVALVAVAALFRRHHQARARIAMVIVAAGLAAGVLAASTDTAMVAQESGWLPVGAWAGFGFSGAALGLWIAGIAFFDGLKPVLTAHSFGVRHLATGGAVTVLLAATIWNGATWLTENLTRDGLQVAEANGAVVPAVARADETGSDRSRVLVLRRSGSAISAALWRGQGEELHETSMVVDLAATAQAGRSELTYSAADQALADSIADLATTGNVGAEWARHAISIVLVPPGEGSERDKLISDLNASADLEYVTENESGAFWRVRADAARAQVISSDGTAVALPSGTIDVHGTIGPGETGRTLRLAEVADPGWHATVNGQALKAISDSWYQEWALPAEGGTVTITFGDWKTDAAAGTQLAILIITIIMALPIKRRRQAR